MDSKSNFGRFVPLLGLGTEKPPPKPLSFVCRNGITFITNAPALRDPASTPANNQSIESIPASTATTHMRVALATDHLAGEDLAGSDGGDTTDDEEWYLEALDVLRGALRSSGQPNLVTHAPRQCQEGDPTAHHAYALAEEGPSALDKALTSAPDLDHHEALLRASMPSPNDVAGTMRFQLERAQQMARKQQQAAKLAMRKDTVKQIAASTANSSKGKNEMPRRDLRALAAAGDEHSRTELEKRRASDREYREQERIKMANGDAAAIERLQKRREANNACQKRRTIAKQRDRDARARQQEQGEHNQA